MSVQEEERPTAVPLRTAIGEAFGAVSMCWEPRPTGEFQSSRAGDILGGVLGRIDAELAAAWRAGRASAHRERGHRCARCEQAFDTAEEAREHVKEAHDKPQARPLLGLATTREMFEEVKARGEVAGAIAEGMAGGHSHAARDMAMVAGDMLEELPAELLDYRTTDA